MKQLYLKTFVLCLMVLAGAKSMAQNYCYYGGLYYILDYDTRAAYVANDGTYNYAGDISIPKSFTYKSTTYTVKGIHPNAFKNCKKVTSVTMPNTITFIEQYTSVRDKKVVKKVGNLR